jgi:hypothetical protein
VRYKDHQTIPQKHWSEIVAFGLSVLLALVPWGQSMLDQHPCIAWLLWSLSVLLFVYVVWRFPPVANWNRIVKSIVVVGVFVIFCRFAYRSLMWRTRPVIVFLQPGVAVNGGTEWTLHTIIRTNRVVSNIRTWTDDAVTGRAVPNEPDTDKRVKMIQGSHVSKTYPDADSASNLGFVVWRPINPNRQEYDFDSVFRVGDDVIKMREKLRIWGDEKKPWTEDKWRFAIHLETEDGRVLMDCRDKGLSTDSESDKQPVPACFPEYPEVDRGLLARCFR